MSFIHKLSLPQRDKCMKVASSLLSEQKSVAVGMIAVLLVTIPRPRSLTNSIADNTNADPETRAVWVQLAQKFGIPIRCAYFTAPAKLCEHNDTVRALSKDHFNPEKRSILPHSAFAGFAARFKEPKVKEGFQDIITIEFQVGKLSSN